MIAVFSLMRRRQDVSLTEFQRHWLDPHGPLVCKFPRLRRYSQNHVTGAGVTDVDGFAELAYDSDADQEAATGSPEMAACDRDSPLFIGSVLRVVTESTEIIPYPVRTDGLAKRITVFTGDAGMAFPAQRRFAATVRQVAGVSGHVENLALRQRGPRSAVPVLDVTVNTIVEVWFENAAAMRRAAADLDAAAGTSAKTYAVKEHRFI